MPDNELKPCPFCGCEAKKASVFGRRGVACTGCVATLRSEVVCDEGNTIYEHWNTRPIEDRLRREIDDLLKGIGHWKSKLDKAKGEIEELKGIDKICADRTAIMVTQEQRIKELEGALDKISDLPDQNNIAVKLAKKVLQSGDGCKVIHDVVEAGDVTKLAGLMNKVRDNITPKDKGE